MTIYITTELNHLTGEKLVSRKHPSLSRAVKFAESYLYHYQVFYENGTIVPFQEVQKAVKKFREVMAVRRFV